MANPNDTTITALPYSLGTMMNPDATNNLSSRQAFIKRKMYKEVPYFRNLPRPLRSWYDKLYFGRVDMIQNGIVVKRETSNLKQIKTATGNIFVLNFVADAFRDLRKNLRIVGDAALIDTNSVYANLDPVVGLEDYDGPLQQNLTDWKRRLTTRIESDPQISNKVVDLKSYIVELFHYLNSRVNDTPLTLTGYVVSNHSSPMISGLSIELQTNSYAADSVKFTKYITDANFPYFVKAARKYGFYVDRNGPWKITADPLSTPMLEYMAQYVNLSPTFPAVSFFNHYYDRTYLADLDGLKHVLREMYNQYAADFPRMSIETQATTGCPPGSLGAQQEVGYRHATSAQQVESLGDRYWLDIYFKIRLRETDLVMTDYESKYRTATALLEAYDMERALRYINNEIKPYLYNVSLGKKHLTVPEAPVRIGTVKDLQSPQQPGISTVPSAPATPTTAGTTTGPTGGSGGSSY